MTWLRADEAAAALGVKLGALRVIAHRHEWRRIRLGRTVAYHLDDVADTYASRTSRRNDNRVTSETDGGA